MSPSSPRVCFSWSCIGGLDRVQRGLDLAAAILRRCSSPCTVLAKAVIALAKPPRRSAAEHVRAVAPALEAVADAAVLAGLGVHGAAAGVDASQLYFVAVTVTPFSRNSDGRGGSRFQISRR